MSNDTFRGHINPLSFVDVEFAAFKSGPHKPIDADSVLRFLCTPGLDSTAEGCIDRYRDLGNVPLALAVMPDDQRLLDKLIWPLRHSRASFVAGNYIGTIALCGNVLEMLALLLWDLADGSLSKRGASQADGPRQQNDSTSKSDFEALPQKKRVARLEERGLIAAATRDEFFRVCDLRNSYLHLWRKDHDQLPHDAKTAFHATITVVASTIGQQVRDGAVVLSVPLDAYLARQQT